MRSAYKSSSPGARSIFQTAASSIFESPPKNEATKISNNPKSSGDNTTGWFWKEDEASNNTEEESLDRALIAAANQGNLARVKEIVKGIETKCGVDINYQDELGWTVLIVACSRGFVEVVIELLKVKRLDINVQTSRYGWTALICSCYNCHATVAVELLKVNSIEVNATEHGGFTALILACQRGLTEVYIRYFI